MAIASIQQQSGANSGRQTGNGPLRRFGSWLKGMTPWGTAERNTDKTIQAQREMADLEWERNLEMWNRGNAYNTPEAQMERLRQAGLNPNLVYGSGGVTGNTTGNLPKYNAPNQQYNYVAPNILGALSAYQDFTMKSAQTDNIKEQNRVIKADAELREGTLPWKTQGEYYKMFNLGETGSILSTRQINMVNEEQRKKELFPYQLDYASGKVSAQELQRELMRKQSSKLDVATDYLQKQNDWYLTKLWSGIINSSMGNVGKILPAGQLGKAGKAVQSGMKPRYNSMENWRQLGY